MSGEELYLVSGIPDESDAPLPQLAPERNFCAGLQRQPGGPVVPPVIRGLTLATILALGALPLPAHARGDGAGATPSSSAGPSMGGATIVPFTHSFAPRSAVIV